MLIPLLVAAGAIGSISLYMFLAWRRANKLESMWGTAFVPFPFQYIGATDEKTIVKKMAVALNSLTTYGPWDKSKLVWSLSRVKVRVVDTDTWKADYCDASGCHSGNVAGQSFSELGTIFVGKNLDALCHELAHYAEWRTEGKTDEAHALWEQRGLNRAIANYQNMA